MDGAKQKAMLEENPLKLQKTGEKVHLPAGNNPEQMARGIMEWDRSKHIHAFTIKNKFHEQS